MILSVSRRTDIPNYYSEWFLNRIREGFLYVRNPVNPHQVSRIRLNPEVVDCIVFWTKNPLAMMKNLSLLKGYPYYFQFTLTGYGMDVEPQIPHKRQVMIPVFQELSRMIGPDRINWRYDPILLSRTYTPDYHMKAFEEIARSLKGYTHKAVISFVDLYAKTVRNTANLGLLPLSEAVMLELAGHMARIATENEMTVESCAEQINLERVGVSHGSCIDKKQIERLTGYRLKAGKDKNQRTECQCVESVEVGTYHTCQNGCRYCYANQSDAQVEKQILLYDPLSPLLCGGVGPEDKITDRAAKSLREPGGIII